MNLLPGTAPYSGRVFFGKQAPCGQPQGATVAMPAVELNGIPIAVSLVSIVRTNLGGLYRQEPAKALAAINGLLFLDNLHDLSLLGKDAVGALKRAQLWPITEEYLAMAKSGMLSQMIQELQSK